MKINRLTILSLAALVCMGGVALEAKAHNADEQSEDASSICPKGEKYVCEVMPEGEYCFCQ